MRTLPSEPRVRTSTPVPLLTFLIFGPLLTPQGAQGQVPVEPGYTITSRGSADRVWGKVDWQTNSAGMATATTNSAYVEVGTGLHFFRDGAWHESRDLVELTPDGGAAALHGPHTVRFQADLASDAPITITSKSNRVFQTYPLGIYYFESKTERLIPLAAVNDAATAELQPPNQIIYRSAFDSGAVKADLRLTYTKAGLESDIIFTHKPKPPSGFGLEDSTTELQVHHAWLNVPEPRTTPRVLANGLVDETLDFGDLWFPLGRAFLADGAENREPTEPAPINLLPRSGESGGVPVAKRWQEMDEGLAVLIESVRWNSVAVELSRLPEMAQAESESEAEETTTEGRPSSDVESPAGKRIELASAPYTPTGFVLDYITVSGSEDYTFSAGVTYYLSSSGYFSGSVVFEPGCIIKSRTSLVCYGSIACGGWPCTLTAADDELYGDHIQGSDGCPDYFSYGLVSYYLSYTVQIDGFRIRWANVGLQIEGDYGGSVTDCQFEHCHWGVSGSGCQFGTYVYVNNVAICGVDYPLGGDCIGGSATDICAGDSDSDGLPDVWEYRYFLNTYSQNGNGNPDGDDLTNLQEYQAGSNPTIDHGSVAGQQVVMTGVGQGINITLVGSSACNEPIVFTIQEGPDFGTLTGTGQNRTYTPNSSPPPAFQGLDTFTYTAGDSLVENIFVYVVPGPTVTSECGPRSITLRWSVPEWVEQANIISDFQIYRCSIASGTCALTQVYQTIADARARMFADTDVAANTVYCYRVSFRAVLSATYESPLSGAVCSTICCPEGFWTDYGGTAQQLAEWIMGPGVMVNNAVYTGATWAKGTFGGATPANLPPGISTGVILCSGDIALAHGPNDDPYAEKINDGIPGDNDLDGLVRGLGTLDATVLEFDFTSSAASVAFEYVFASEEYHIFIGDYNDIMAIWVDGVNIAVVPNTSPPVPVAVNTIHNGYGQFPPQNPQYFVDNDVVPAPLDIQYNGLTTLLSAATSITPNVSHHVKIAIADAIDRRLDSAVFIKAAVPCP